jgi:hypothetical protein
MVLLFTIHPGAHAVVSPGERQGLVNLYIATGGPGWTAITHGWHNHANASVDPCDPPATVWTGVSCSGTTSITYVSGIGRGIQTKRLVRPAAPFLRLLALPAATAV